MKREDVENTANVFYEASKLRSTTWETELIAFAVQQVNAALEEAAKSAARHFIPGHSVAGPAFAQDGAEKIRALKIP